MFSSKLLCDQKIGSTFGISTAEIIVQTLSVLPRACWPSCYSRCRNKSKQSGGTKDRRLVCRDCEKFSSPL